MMMFARTSSVLVAEVGEPPDVAEPHTDGDAGEEEVELVPPLAPRRTVLLPVHVDLRDLITGFELYEVVLLIIRHRLSVL